MLINFLCNVVFDGWEPTDTRLGGTEKGVVEWAEELVKRGHQVVVYRNGIGIYEFNGVFYSERQLYKGNGDICINIKSSDIAPKGPTIYYTNEVDATERDLSHYDAVIHISQWAKDNIPVNNPNVFVLPHGYNEKHIYPGKKIPKQCLYASSPDRGLDTLLEAWPDVQSAHPDATLLLTYGVTGVELPGVICLGDLDEAMMDELYISSDIWCHPCNGGELQCITGMKAQAAGCIPVIIPTMALSETVGRGFKTDKEHYGEVLSSVLAMSPEQRDTIRRNVTANAPLTTIEQSTDKLLAVINNVLQSKKDKPE